MGTQKEQMASTKGADVPALFFGKIHLRNGFIEDHVISLIMSDNNSIRDVEAAGKHCCLV